jgi:hypothetical protein
MQPYEMRLSRAVGSVGQALQRALLRLVVTTRVHGHRGVVVDPHDVLAAGCLRPNSATKRPAGVVRSSGVMSAIFLSPMPGTVSSPWRMPSSAGADACRLRPDRTRTRAR